VTNRPFVLGLGGAAVFFAWVARGFVERYRLPLRAEAGLYLCLMLLVALAAVPAIPGGRRAVERLGIPGAIGVWLAPYLIYAWGCADFRWAAAARLLAICAPPFLVYGAAPVRNLAVFAWQDAIAWSWLALAVVLREIEGIWSVPVSLDFMARLMTIGVASWCWVVVRPVPGVGYRFSFSGKTLRAAALGFAGAAVIALPASYAMHFAAWKPRWHGAGALFANYAEIFIFIAWLEELLFRGVLQTLLANRLKSAVWGQAAASLAFGFSHVLLGHAPNWRYVALASVAGWFYGSAFRRCGNLTGAAMAHAAVDTAWRTWFGGG
jgi:membrane protease YdiL (CAAX protease family)